MAISKPIHTILLMSSLKIKPTAKTAIRLLKQKQSQPFNSINKYAKINRAIFDFYWIFEIFFEM